MNLVNQNNELIATAIAMDSDNIDTDQIIPARYMKVISFHTLGQNVFIDQRKAAQEQNRIHPFDNPELEDSRILVVAKNFGCGSSREHAPQALHRWGIDVVVGESFGEIFRGNCASIGLPCLTVSEQDAAALRELIVRHPQQKVCVDFSHKEIRIGELSVAFSIREKTRKQILTGRLNTPGNALAELMAEKQTIETLFQQLPYCQNFTNLFNHPPGETLSQLASNGGQHELQYERQHLCQQGGQHG